MLRGPHGRAGARGVHEPRLGSWNRRRGVPAENVAVAESVGLCHWRRAAGHGARVVPLNGILHMSDAWKLNGTVFVACNCDWGCPCNFNALPTKGKCEGGWTWHVDKGTYGQVTLDDLNFSVYVNWPAAIHDGNGEALILVDERADARQRAAIDTLVGGKVGGPWRVLA